MGGSLIGAPATPAAVSLKELSKQVNVNYEHFQRVARSMFQKGTLNREKMPNQGMGRPSWIYSLP